MIACDGFIIAIEADMIYIYIYTHIYIYHQYRRNHEALGHDWSPNSDVVKQRWFQFCWNCNLSLSIGFHFRPIAWIGATIADYNDVKMSAVTSQITTVSIVAQLSVQAQIKEHMKAPRHWPLCGEFTGDRKAENVYAWRRHHGAE